jgi:hypothetical protein
MNMNPRLFMVLVVLTVIASTVLLSCGRVSDSEPFATEATSAGEDKAEELSALPSLVVDKNAPLLLKEPTENEKSFPAAATRAGADNTACFVCHAGYGEEPLTGWHAIANVGCVDCHGKSYPHRNDENNTTPPDIMYPADGIDLFCQKCHTSHDVPAAKVVARWQQRRSDKTDLKVTVCTDCHGDHRLKLRSVQWDKKTGKLLRSVRAP